LVRYEELNAMSLKGIEFARKVEVLGEIEAKRGLKEGKQ